MPVDQSKYTKPNPPNGQGAAPPSSLKESLTIAKEVQEVASSGLRGAAQEGLDNVRSFIQETADKRSQAVDQASDAIVALTSPDLFVAEVFDSAQQKMGGTNPPKSSNPYAGFTVSKHLPQLSSSRRAGSLAGG